MSSDASSSTTSSLHLLRKPVLWYAIALAASVGGAFWWAEDLEHQSQLTELVGGPLILESIQKSPSWMVQRVRLNGPWNGSNDLCTPYDLIGEPKHVDGGDARRLAEVITSSRSYSWHKDPKGCIVEFAVRFIAEGEQGRSEAWICFGCDDVMFVHDSKVTGFAEFEPMRTELLGIVKRLFPEDFRDPEDRVKVG